MYPLLPCRHGVENNDRQGATYVEHNRQTSAVRSAVAVEELSTAHCKWWL